VSSYYYPYMSYHLSHERLIYPALGIAPDEKVVAHALPRIMVALDVMGARAPLSHRRPADAGRFSSFSPP